MGPNAYRFDWNEVGMDIVEAANLVKAAVYHGSWTAINLSSFGASIGEQSSPWYLSNVLQ